MTHDEWMTAVQAAECIGYAPATLAEWRQRKRGPAYVRSDGAHGHVRYRRSDLDAWLDARTVRLTADDEACLSMLTDPDEDARILSMLAGATADQLAATPTTQETDQ